MSSRPVLLIAHRGESFDAPENTPAAFDLAWQRGCDAIELDVHLTADGQVAVCHDRDTLRTAGVGHVIRETALAVLRTLDVGSWKHPRWRGQRIATLDDVLDHVPAGKRVFVEIKAGVEAIDAVAAVVERHGSVATTVIGFNLDVVRAMKRRLPGKPALWLVSPKRDEAGGRWTPGAAEMIARARDAGADGLDLDAAFPADAGFVSQARSAGLSVYVWTVDDPDRARAWIAAGVDGVTTNRADWLRQQLSLPA